MENELRNCIANIQSSKLTEKKKGVEDLRGYLCERTVIELLNKQSKKENSSISWNAIFHASHQVFLHSADRIKEAKLKSLPALENSKTLCSSLVAAVVSKANTDVQYLDCKTVIEAVLQVLESSAYKNIIGDNYITILNDHILSSRKYCAKLEPKYWIDLFEISVDFLENTFPVGRNAEIVSMLNVVIQYGCEFSCLASVMKKKLFDVLKKLVKDVHDKNDNFQIKILILLVTVCDRLQKECRTAICKFGEETAETILNLYQQKIGNSEKKNMIFDFLLIIVEAHHPKGVDENSFAAYAFDWNTWKKILRKINVFIVTEVNSVVKYGKFETISPNFLNLSVLVFKQIFHSCGNSLDVTVGRNFLNETSLTEGPTKRMRITGGFADIIDRLNKVSGFVYMLPWLCITQEIIQKYPSLVNESDYMLLLRNMSELLSASKESLVTDYLCKCCISLMKVGKSLNLEEEDIQSENALWESISQTLLRTIGLNQSIQWSHTLIQRMIESRWKSSIGNAILKLYLSGVVRLSEPSLLTLYCLRQRTSFPETFLEISVWSSLLRWGFPTITVDQRNFFASNIDLYAHMLVLICLKNNIKKKYTQIEPPNFDLYPKSSISNVDIFMLASYESDLFLRDDEIEITRHSDNQKITSVINNRAFEQLVHILEEAYVSLTETCDLSNDKFRAFRNFRNFVLLLLHIEKFQNHYDIELSSRLQAFSVDLIQKMVGLATNVLNSRCEEDVQELLEELAEFFKHLGVFPLAIVNSVVNEFYSLLEFVFKIIKRPEMKSENQDDIDGEIIIKNDNSSVFDFESLSVRDKRIIEACKVITYYSYNYERLNDNQYNVLVELLEIIADFSNDAFSLCLLHTATTSIQIALKLKTMDSTILDKVTIVLRALCDPGEWYIIEESAVVMLNLLQHGIRRLSEIEDKSLWKNFKILVSGIEEATKARGPKTITEVVYCLGSLFMIGEFEKYASDEEIQAIAQKLLNYLKHPFHEVRMAATRFVSSIFKIMDFSYKKKKFLLQKENIVPNFQKVLCDIFIVENLQMEEEIDENINRPLTVLYALGSMICCSQLARREGLFLLFCLTFEKRLNNVLVHKILTLVKLKLKLKDEIHLVKDNSVYILWSWFEKYEKFENFPYQAIRCKSNIEFYDKFLEDIVPVLMLYGKMNMVADISKLLNLSSQQTIEKCFPEIMAILLRKISDNSGAPVKSINETEIYSFLEKKIGSSRFKDLMMSELSSVMTALFRNLYDPKFQIPQPSILPSAAPFRSNEKQVLETIEYLQSTSEEPDSPLIIFMITCGCSDYIQKIFQRLYIDVVKASTPEIKLESFQKYVLFCRILLPYFDDLSKAEMAAFIARTIIFNLLHFISTEEEHLDVSLASLRFFNVFISDWLFSDKKRKQILSVFEELLSTIVNKLVTLALEKNELGLEALKVLQNVINDKSECLLEAIQKLEPFPDLPQFDTLKTYYMQMQNTQSDTLILTSDIVKFLDVVENFESCSVESLKYLQKQLSVNKAELGEMFKELNFGRGFSEQCAASKPHKLICWLLKLINSGGNNVKYESVRCLGQIGLVDLHSLVLKPNCEEYDYDIVPENLITSHIVEMLKECIFEKDDNLIKSSSKALYVTLSSVEGYAVAKDLKMPEKLALFPFLSSKKSNSPNLWTYFDSEKFKTLVDNSSLWSPTDISFEDWIVNLVSSILDSFSEECFLHVLQSVCRIKVSCSAELFKYLVLLILKSHMQEPKEILSERVQQFFKNHFYSSVDVISDSCASSRSNKESNIDIHVNKLAVKCLLDVVHFVRLKQEQPQLNILNLNHLHVAKAAQFCSLYFSSVMYAELWINFQIQNNGLENDGNILSVLELIGNNSVEEKNELLNILREAFSKIGDSDALYGCGSSLLLNSETRILHYSQTENWTRVMESCDILLNSGSHVYSTINDLSTAIGLAGFSYLQNQYLSSLTNLNIYLKNQSYESGWKLSKWDLPEPDENEKTFSYHQYAAIRDLKQKNFEEAKINIENARRLLIPGLARIGLESTKNIYHTLSNLQCLQDIEDYLKTSSLNDILDKWINQDELSARLNFKYKEVIFNQRIRIIDLEDEASADFVLNIAKLARKEKNFNYAESCLSFIKNKNASVSTFFEMKLTLEEAKILWCRKETLAARYLLKHLLNSCDNDGLETFQSKLLRIYGTWLSEINLENADIIFDDYFLPSTSKIKDRRIENEKEKKSRLKTFKCVGEFADSQYQQISKYIKSDEFQRQQQRVKEARIQSEAIVASKSMELRKTKAQLANQSKIDDSFVNEIKNKQNRYLILAMGYYLKLLAESEQEDLRIFRVISLWLENKAHAELHLLLKENLLNVPSYKFVLVLPQLIAHLTRNTAECFGYSLNKVIEKCAYDHPHHTLPLILSLAKYVKDEEYSECGSKFAKEERVMAACEYMKKFSQNSKIGEIAKQMELLSDAYIELAYDSIGRPVGYGEKFNISAKFLIVKLRNIDKVLCPTIMMPVSKRALYDNITGIQRIESTFMSVGGVNAPKKIACICTDGITRYQLVKGRDDMRQDAVMQQVFTIMNKLLLENKHTSKRKLLIRTYKVIPLSQRSGILEWCTNTMSFMDYLAFKSESKRGAHNRYRPQDILTHKARQRMDSVKSRSDEDKLKTYKDICRQLKPVFRYFFLEKFPSPTMWFERKLAYIHSVAVTSIVGYIIGLGDRHVQNILIDEQTAEVIHIDFGIAFDQGLLLTFPERIPFRLTRDIEDGMGVFAIDGIFRRCCEQTLAVLRQNKNIIQTTIEVFLYDPLYQWTVTPEKKASMQSTSRKNLETTKTVTEVNVTAPRALAGVMSKLQGLEEGTYTTIEGQVNRLIQQAKDPHNLSRLYCGWQPYL